MPTIDTIVVGAGQAGLAASRGLAARGRDHVVLERGRIGEQGLQDEVLDPEPLARVLLEPADQELDLRAEGITSVVWATGHRRNYDWLQVPVLDASGEIRQRRGVTPVPGLYVLDQRFQYRRSSNFIGGVGRDATFVADHIAHAR
jgi:putative flavoprotein involved in K+ transport